MNDCSPHPVLAVCTCSDDSYGVVLTGYKRSWSLCQDLSGGQTLVRTSVTPCGVILIALC